MLLFFSRFLLLLLLYFLSRHTETRHVDRGFIIPGVEGEERRLIGERGKN